MPVGVFGVLAGVVATLTVVGAGAGALSVVAGWLTGAGCPLPVAVGGKAVDACAMFGMGATANRTRPASACLRLLRLPDCPPRAIRRSHRDPSTIVFMARDVVGKMRPYQGVRACGNLKHAAIPRSFH